MYSPFPIGDYKTPFPFLPQEILAKVCSNANDPVTYTGGRKTQIFLALSWDSLKSSLWLSQQPQESNVLSMFKERREDALMLLVYIKGVNIDNVEQSIESSFFIFTSSQCCFPLLGAFLERKKGSLWL